ncbi:MULTISPECIES: DoxX family protein [unclassified Empedobacter]|uniref:DoxX family protein n=1 Tax=unclassified Empedobacter TaxID=2643773 RepID=UPI0025BEFF0B|nr:MULTISPECIES: MauE/DoxX family redox-associated membrane protein [unclassified Empedobacter]
MRKIAPFIQTLICYLFIVLFVYAAVSKLMDFETFQTQLGQSPLLASYAISISYGIIILELVTAVLLMFERTRKIALQISLLLMVMFTTYIVIILHFTPFTPCSCGGVLEKMGWTEHLIFNVVFVGLALIGIRITKSSQTWRGYIIEQTTLTIIGIVSVTILYSLSEQKSQYNNAFTRKYIPHLAEKLTTLNLESTGYYIAGIDSCYAYLAHPNAPLFLRTYDYHTQNVINNRIKIKNELLPYKRIITSVNSPYFYLGDGTVGIIEKGILNDYTASLETIDNAYYNQYVPGKKDHFGLSITSQKTKQTALALLYKTVDGFQIKINDTSLKSHYDGAFDLDGLLIWNEQHQIFLFVYYYKNEIIILDSMMNEKNVMKSIDSLNEPELDVAFYKKDQNYRLGPKTIRVNETIATYGDYLYIHSKRLGNFEEEHQSASIIDVYDLVNNHYLHSFYLYHKPKQQLMDFKIYQNSVFAVIDDEIYRYQLKK